MKNILFNFFLFLILFNSCYFERERNEPLEIINIKDVFNKNQTFNLSDIANRVEYIQLESTNESLIGDIFDVYSNEENFIVVEKQHIFLFNKLNGQFIREVGIYGKGPGEYMNTDRMLSYNDINNTVFVTSSKVLYEYSLEGKIIDTCNMPPQIYGSAYLGNNIFVGYRPNFNGDEKIKLIYYNDINPSIKTITNYQIAQKPNGMVIYKPHAWFYRYDKRLFFFELFNDTLFQVTSSGLTPRYIFDMGKYLPPYEKQTSLDFATNEVNDYFIMKSVFESSRYIFYTFRYQFKYYLTIFDKTSKVILINNDIERYGTKLNNDIDNFLPINFLGTSERDQLLGYIQPYEIIQWFSENPEKASKISPYLKELKNIKETDNPVLVVATLKK
jgi:hypothetical protein